MVYTYNSYILSYIHLTVKYGHLTPRFSQISLSERRKYITFCYCTGCFVVTYVSNPNFLHVNVSLVQTPKLSRCYPHRHISRPILRVYGTNPFITSVVHCECSEGGLLRLVNRKQPPGMAHSTQTPLCCAY